MNSIKLLAPFVLVASLIIATCKDESDPITPSDYVIDRESKIPTDVVKGTPQNDAHPPMLVSAEFEQPMPVPYPFSTAGAEDSPFIPAGKDELYFFFTPDVRVPPEKQLLDSVTGIWLSRRVNTAWTKPVRVMLQEKGKLALDGCEFVTGDTMWFCSAREGYAGLHWFIAFRAGGGWANWKNADFDPAYEVGELHMHHDQLYYHSARAGGKGGIDIWFSKKVGGAWQEPENVAAVNTGMNESQPFITADGNELWFTRTYLGTPAVYRSKKSNGQWQLAQLIVYQFAGEPTVDANGDLYFVHHFYKNNVMIEADIYIAKKK